MPEPELKDFALVVGINTYADKKFLEPLGGPKNDVQRFLEWLQSQPGGDDITRYVLESDDVGETPKTGDIVDAIKKLLAFSPGGDERIGRRLYIFLAGHGVGPDLDDAGLLTAEATEDAPTYVEGRRYANLFRGRAAFEEVVLIMDCCRDYDGELPEPYFPFKKKVDAGGAHKVKRFYAYATGFGRAAREKDFGQEGKDISGIFSRVLVEGLKGRAVDGEGRITGASLERYVKKQLKKHLPKGVEQTADIRSDPDLVFADGLPPATVDVTVEATIPHATLAVLYGNGFKPVQTAPQAIGAGKYTIQLPIGKTYVFRILDAAGVVLKEDGRAIEDVDEVISVTL